MSTEVALGGLLSTFGLLTVRNTQDIHSWKKWEQRVLQMGLSIPSYSPPTKNQYGPSVLTQCRDYYVKTNQYSYNRDRLSRARAIRSRRYPTTIGSPIWQTRQN